MQFPYPSDFASFLIILPKLQYCFRKRNGLTMVDIDVASLNMIESFNGTLLMERLLKALSEVISDGDIGGFSIDPDITTSVMISPPQQGKLIDIIVISVTLK